MPEFFDVKGKVEKQGHSDAVEDSTVELANADDFPANVIDSVLAEGRNVDNLQNSNSGHVNKLVCRPENQNTFKCEALVHDTVVTSDGLQTVENMVLEADKKDVVRVQTEQVKVEDGVLKTHD